MRTDMTLGDACQTPQAADARRTVVESAVRIDAIFAGTGERLGESLAIFESLNASLSRLAEQMGGSALAGTAATLNALAGELRQLAADIPEETATLRAIGERNREATRLLQRLLQNMRMITVLARGARIEAASVAANQTDFLHFTQDILNLTNAAQKSVEACARDQAALTDNLSGALAAQLDFEHQYGGELVGLAEELTETFGHISSRQSGSAALASQAAARAQNLAGTVGRAVVSLQAGDSTRQRLEHVAVVLGRETARPAANVSAPALAVAAGQLGAAQLEGTARELGDNVAAIDLSLADMKAETGLLIDTSRSLYGGGGAEATSFTARLEKKLVEASRLIGKCHAASASLDGITAGLTGLLERFDDTVSGPEQVVLDIVLIGINAGLKAGRLGSEGKGLVLIAHELREIADVIAEDSRQLMPIFALVQEAAAKLDRADAAGTRPIAEIEEALRTAVSQMRESGRQLMDTLARLGQDGMAFGTTVDHARRQFAEASAIGEALREAGFALAQQISRASEDDIAAAWTLLEQRVRPVYTMADERRIHDALAPGSAVAPPEGSEALLMWA